MPTITLIGFFLCYDVETSLKFKTISILLNISIFPQWPQKSYWLFLVNLLKQTAFPRCLESKSLLWICYIHYSPSVNLFEIPLQLMCTWNLHVQQRNLSVFFSSFSCLLSLYSTQLETPNLLSILSSTFFTKVRLKIYNHLSFLLLWWMYNVNVHVWQSSNVLREKLSIRGIKHSMQKKRWFWLCDTCSWGQLYKEVLIA